MSLINTNISARSITRLPAIFPAVQVLWLDRCKFVNNHSVASLSALVNLNALSLSFCPRISGAVLAHVPSMTALQALALQRVAVTEAQLIEHAPALSNLRTLDLRGCDDIDPLGDGLLLLRTIEQLSVRL